MHDQLFLKMIDPIDHYKKFICHNMIVTVTIVPAVCQY